MVVSDQHPRPGTAPAAPSYSPMRRLLPKRAETPDGAGDVR